MRWSYGNPQVTDWSAASFLLAMLSAAPAEPSAADPIQFAQVMIREQILIRVPARPVPGASQPQIEWNEGKGPKCVAMGSIAGAGLVGPNSVDLILRDRSRVRAKLEKSCPALDYYYGFYIRPSGDGQICADRDSVRSRMGGECEIEKFRSLVAKAKD
jgi:hypothetical protein